MELNRIIHGDSIEEMRKLVDKSVDMILCDLPYGTTACKWDTIIPFEPLWAEYERIIKDNGAIVLTASQPFTSFLITSNLKMYRYNLVWKKSHPSNPMLAKKQPLKYHEDICVFYKKLPKYFPQMTAGEPNHSDSYGGLRAGLGTVIKASKVNKSGLKYPKSVINFNCEGTKNRLHPTQKPVPLFEYLIKTYTNEGDVVLDNCIGSGTTAVAAINAGRNFIGIERELDYVEIANKRIADALKSKEAE